MDEEQSHDRLGLRHFLWDIFEADTTSQSEGPQAAQKYTFRPILLVFRLILDPFSCLCLIAILKKWIYRRIARGSQTLTGTPAKILWRFLHAHMSSWVQNIVKLACGKDRWPNVPNLSLSWFRFYNTPDLPKWDMANDNAQPSDNTTNIVGTSFRRTNDALSLRTFPRGSVQLTPSN